MHLHNSRGYLVKVAALFAALGLMLAPAVALAQTGSSSSEYESEFETELENGYVGRAFILDGTRSSDDGVIRTYTWTQVSGPVAVLSSTSSDRPTFTPQTAGTYVFEVVATDSTGLNKDTKQITVAVTATDSSSSSIVQNNQTNLDFITAPSTTTGGTEDINIGAGEQKGNVEFDWKVEEGQKGGPALLEIDTIKGESPDDEKGGNVEYGWKVEEGESAAGADASDRLRNAGPVNDWPISVSAVVVRGWDPEKKQEILGKAKPADQLQTEADLADFATATLLNDVKLKGIKIKENAIDVDYSMPAELFGIIPVSYTANVSVNKGDNENWDFGKTKIKFPWFAFLLRKGTSQDELTQAVQQQGNEEGSKDWIELESWSFGAQAQALQTMSNVLNSMHNSAKSIIQNIKA